MKRRTTTWAVTVILLIAFGSCKKNTNKEEILKDIISGTYSITLVEKTEDGGITWKEQQTCLKEGTFTFKTKDIIVYTKSACTGDKDYTGGWTYNASTNRLIITKANEDIWDGIAKNITGSSFVLDESAIPNHVVNYRCTFTKR